MLDFSQIRETPFPMSHITLARENRLRRFQEQKNKRKEILVRTIKSLNKNHTIQSEILCQAQLLRIEELNLRKKLKTLKKRKEKQKLKSKERLNSFKKNALKLIKTIHPEREYDLKLAIRLLKDVMVDKDKNCWFLNSDRWDEYATITINKQTHRAHRFSYELFKGPLNNLFCCHKCDRRGCINPDHLFKGTHADNMHDAINKGRLKSPIVVHGRNHPITKEKQRLRKEDNLRQIVWIPVGGFN